MGFDAIETLFGQLLHLIDETRLIFDSSDGFGQFLVVLSHFVNFFFHFIVFSLETPHVFFIGFPLSVKLSELVLVLIDLLHGSLLLIVLSLNAMNLLFPQILQHQKFFVSFESFLF